MTRVIPRNPPRRPLRVPTVEDVVEIVRPAPRTTPITQDPEVFISSPVQPPRSEPTPVVEPETTE